MFEVIDLKCGCRVYIPEADREVLQSSVTLDDYLEVNYIRYIVEGPYEIAKCKQCGKEWEL